MKTNKIRTLTVAIFGATLAALSGCGGGAGGSDSTANTTLTSAYVTFAGSANGESVRDANNEVVKFLKVSRSMEVFTKAPTDITLDSTNNLVQGGNKIIGAVQLVAGDNNSAIAGLVATNGTMLAVNNISASSATLKATTTIFAKPGTVSTSSSGNSTATGTGSTSSTASCTIANYKGPNDDPQTDSFCKNAYINQCLDTATGTTTYKTQTVSVCKVLDGLLKSISNTTATAYCSYCR